MHQNGLKLLGLLLALLFAIALMFSDRKAPPAAIEERPGDYHTVRPVPGLGDSGISREASVISTPSKSSTGAQAVGRVITESGFSVGDGQLALPGTDPIVGVPVAQGLISSTPLVAELQISLELDPSRVWFLHSSGSWNPVLDYSAAGEDGVFDVVVPDPRAIRIEVVNLKGEPVESAEISFFAALPTTHAVHGLTGADGGATITLFPKSPSYLYQIRKPGFLHEFGVVDVFDAAYIKLRMKRVLAAGIITDQRSPSTFHQLSMPDELRHVPRLSSFQYRQVLERVEAQSNLAFHETAFWLVSAEDDVWVETSAIAAARDADGNTFGPISIPMLQVTDPELSLYRSALATMQDHGAVLDLRIVSSAPVPDSAWLSRIAFAVRGTPAKPETRMGRSYFGRLTSPGQYRAFLPPGNFQIETVDDKLLLSAGAAPRLEATPVISLQEGLNPPVDVVLRSDHQLIEVCLESLSGFPVALHAALIPEIASPIHPNDQGSRLSRFIQHGIEYRLDVLRAIPDQSLTVLENLVLPEEAKDSGRWRLIIPDRDPRTGSGLWPQ